MNLAESTGTKHPSLPLFFTLSLLAWVIWLSQAAHRYGALAWAPSLQSPLNALTVWSPGLAAMFLTWRAYGKTEVASLFRPLGQWRMPLRWYAIALLLEPAKWGLALFIDRATGLNYELGPALLVRTFTAASAFMVPVAVVFTLPNALGEELGWRAFALPRLQKLYGPLGASVALGLFWGFWHIPANVAWASGPLPVWWHALMVLNMVPTAILFTWIFNRTGRSLLLMCLFHASIANKGYFLPKLPTSTEVLIAWLIALAVVLSGGMSQDRNAAPAPESGSQVPNIL